MKSALAKIEKEIISDPKLINNFTIVINSLIDALQLKNKALSLKCFEKASSILSHYLLSKTIQPAQSLKNFLYSKVDLLVKISIDLLKLDENITEEMASALFEILAGVFKFKSAEEMASVYEPLITALFFSPQEAINSSMIVSFNKVFKQEQLNILKTLNDDRKAISSEFSAYNIYNYLIIQPHIDLIETRAVYQSIMVKLINSSYFPSGLLKSFLLSLNKGVLENVSNPLIFSDFIISKTASTASVGEEDKHDIQILGLTALFVLITKYKLDFEDYYKLLYRLIRSGAIFESQYYMRLYKVIALSLKSPLVPLNVICSFVKLLSRLSLFAKDVHVMLNLTIMMMVIQCHPKTLRLLTYKKTKKEEKESRNENSAFDWKTFNEAILDKQLKAKAKPRKTIEESNRQDEDGIEALNANGTNEEGDLFNENEDDPYTTQAQFSSLWELYTLENHFNVKIRKLVNKFKSNFLPKQVDFDFSTKNKEMQKKLLFDIEKNNAHFYLSS